jgi:hypothetical protein
MTTRDSIAHSKRLYWLTGGLGLGGERFALLAKANVAIGVESFIFRVIVSDATSLGGGSNYGHDFRALGLYYGRQFYEGVLIGRIAAGISYLDGPAKHGREKIHTLTFGVEAELLVQAFVAGLGISLFGEVSPAYFYGGLTLNVHFGILD